MQVIDWNGNSALWSGRHLTKEKTGESTNLSTVLPVSEDLHVNMLNHV